MSTTKKRNKVRGKFQPRHDPEKMRFELERRKTFKTWSKTCPIQPGPLAEAGFYYLGVMDRVKCFSCGGEIEEWEDGDTAMGEHEKLFPHCDMVKNIEKKNVTINEQLNEIKNRRKAGKEEADGQIVLDMKINIDSVTSKDLVDAYCKTSFTGDLTLAKDPLLVDELIRYNTFRDWPAYSKLSSSETRWLANAGFYYTGPGDRARCFYCAGRIEFWEEDDEPWSEHAKNFPTCQWLIDMKGKAFVDEVQTQRFANLEISSDQRQEESLTTNSDPGSFATAKSSEDNQSSTTASTTGPTTGYPQWTGLERLVCRVCNSENVSTVFCPCNHEAACLQCARVALTCPECGLPVNTYEPTSGFL